MSYKKYTNHLEQELNTFEQQLSTIQQMLAKESAQHREYLAPSKRLLLKRNIVTYSKVSCLTVRGDKLQPLLAYFNSRLAGQIELYQNKIDKQEVLDTMSDFSLFASQEVIKLYKERCEWERLK